MAALPMILIVMGVAGSGKTTVGRQLAHVLGWQFVEGDDFHPPTNVAKMSQGQPLTDVDRAPWLATLRIEIERLLVAGTSAVVTCSALKQRYRDILQSGDSDRVQVVYLQGSSDTLKSRLAQRQGHFMKVDMLESQLAALEEPEEAIVIDLDRCSSVEAIVTAICDRLAHRI